MDIDPEDDTCPFYQSFWVYHGLFHTLNPTLFKTLYPTSDDWFARRRKLEKIMEEEGFGPKIYEDKPFQTGMQELRVERLFSLDEEVEDYDENSDAEPCEIRPDTIEKIKDLLKRFHQKGWVHFDLMNDCIGRFNMMLDKDRNPKMIDFDTLFHIDELETPLGDLLRQYLDRFNAHYQTSYSLKDYIELEEKVMG